MLKKRQICVFVTELMWLFFFLPAEALDETAPGECCFHFFTERIPVKNIVSVTKTHSSCLEKAFEVCDVIMSTWIKNLSKCFQHLFESIQ
uniref:Chemokine interleukin-8-like domain-containing protein n=1 Tax=Maylandia zebra TaxID=106582 RepID=A0A3P9CCD9_9CICH